jgi:hypothetical protein
MSSVHPSLLTTGSLLLPDSVLIISIYYFFRSCTRLCIISQGPIQRTFHKKQGQWLRRQPLHFPPYLGVKQSSPNSSFNLSESQYSYLKKGLKIPLQNYQENQ